MRVTGYVAGVPCPVDIEPIDTNPIRGPYLAHDAAAAFRAMRAAAALDGIVLKANSGWRSYETQTRLYREWQEGKRKPRPSKPGWSKHHSGAAVDIQRSHDGRIDVWLSLHAQEHGFVNNVPGEAWHWEYVGTAA